MRAVYLLRTGRPTGKKMSLKFQNLQQMIHLIFGHTFRNVLDVNVVKLILFEWKFGR